MAALIVFPDVEALGIGVLNDDVRMPVGWSTKVPNPRPDEFGILQRTGGPRETFVSENATLILETWAETEGRAVVLLNLARAILASQEGNLFGYSEAGGPNNLPDPTSNQVRYTLTVSVRARGSVLA